jgi:hypothetical protein
LVLPLPWTPIFAISSTFIVFAVKTLIQRCSLRFFLSHSASFGIGRLLYFRLPHCIIFNCEGTNHIFLLHLKRTPEGTIQIIYYFIQRQTVKTKLISQTQIKMSSLLYSHIALRFSGCKVLLFSSARKVTPESTVAVCAQR